MKNIQRTERKDIRCLKDITKALRANFKGIQANSYGYSCNNDYDDKHSYNYINNNDYIICKLYKGGINNNYHQGWDDIGNEVYYGWNLTNFNLDNIIKVMQSIANKYGYKVVKPQDNLHCIKLLFN